MTEATSTRDGWPRDFGRRSRPWLREREGPALRRGRDSTDRCVPARSPSAADHERACLLQSQKKIQRPQIANSAVWSLELYLFLQNQSVKDRKLDKFCIITQAKGKYLDVVSEVIGQI